MLNSTTPVLGFAAFSGTGKTTLLAQLIPLLRQRGTRIGLVKHAHHAFDIDHPGKDSYVLRHAGAEQVLVASRRRWALIVEDEQPDEPRLETLLGELLHERLDLVLVEGFKHESFPKIELHRPSLGHPLLFPDDRNIIAIATDKPLGMAVSIPVLDLNEPQRIAAYIATNFLGDSADQARVE